MAGSKYTSYQDAANAARALNITSSTEYVARYKEDDQLPLHPSRKYKGDWQGWPTFLGQEAYATYAEAQQAALNMGIRSSTQYFECYNDDPHLPPDPKKTYATDWQGWPAFLNTTHRFYRTLADASAAAIALGITSEPDYSTRYKNDPKLPSNPSQHYATEWQDWYVFLGKSKRSVYSSLAEASAAAQALNIATSTEYAERYKADPMLPSRPDTTFSAEWADWNAFLGIEAPAPSKPQPVPESATSIDTTASVRLYATYREASKAAQTLKITSSRTYTDRRSEDPRLPSNPRTTYPKQWQGWDAFLGNSKNYGTYAEAAQAAQKLGITSSRHYATRRKDDPRLPANPHRTYKADWSDWIDFLQGAHTSAELVSE